MYMIMRRMLFILAVVGSFSLNAMYMNYGFILLYDVRINTYEFINYGTLKGLNRVDINVSTLRGSGTIDGKNIRIICDDFKYDGSISCNNVCTIYTKKAFDYSMFKHSGSGNFTVIVSPYPYVPYTYDSLISEGFQRFCSDCLRLYQGSIDEIIKITRRNAVMNMLHDVSVLESIKRGLEQEVAYHKEHINAKRDKRALNEGLTYAWAGAIGLGVASALYQYNNVIAKKFFAADTVPVNVGAAVVGGISALPLLISIPSFLQWYNPQHKERYEQLSLIVERLTYAINTVRVPEEQIIKLQ